MKVSLVYDKSNDKYLLRTEHGNVIENLTVIESTANEPSEADREFIVIIARISKGDYLSVDNLGFLV